MYRRSNLRTRMQYETTFTPRSSYSWIKRPRCPSKNCPDDPQSRAENRNCSDCPRCGISCQLTLTLPRTGHEGAMGEQRNSSTLSLTSTLVEGGWSKTDHGRFNPGYPQYRRLGGPTADLDGCGRSHPNRDSIPGSPACSE